MDLIRLKQTIAEGLNEIIGENPTVKNQKITKKIILLFEDFIEQKKINQKLEIDLSQEDLEDMLHCNKDFHWTFTTDKGEDIDIHLFKED